MRDMSVFERSTVTVFGAEMQMFDRTHTEKEQVSQSMELCRDFIHSRIIREGFSWSKIEPDLPEPHGALIDVSVVLLKLGKRTCRSECELMLVTGVMIFFIISHNNI